MFVRASFPPSAFLTLKETLCSVLLHLWRAENALCPLFYCVTVAQPRSFHGAKFTACVSTAAPDAGLRLFGVVMNSSGSVLPN